MFQACAVFDYIYFSHCLICCSLIGVAYGIYGRYDVILWCLFIVLASVLNCVAVSMMVQKGKQFSSSSRVGNIQVVTEQSADENREQVWKGEEPEEPEEGAVPTSNSGCLTCEISTEIYILFVVTIYLGYY